MQYLIKRGVSDIVVTLHREILAISIDNVIVIIAEEDVLCLIFIRNYKPTLLQLLNLLLNRFKWLHKKYPLRNGEGIPALLPVGINSTTLAPHYI